MVAEGSSLETLRHMVASGLGVTVLPASAAGLENYAPGYLKTKPFSKPEPSRTVAIAWRKQFPRTEAIDLLIDVTGNRSALSSMPNTRQPSELQGLTGVGPKVEHALNRLGLYSCRDLLFHLPARYEDRTTRVEVAHLKPEFHNYLRVRLPLNR